MSALSGRTTFGRLNLPLAEWRGGVLVALSGGADSMALAVLAKQWTDGIGVPLFAVICDHGIRAESADEARTVLDRASELGIRAEIVRLNLCYGSGIQERARIARYAALLDIARRRGAGLVAVGHHRLDQAETIAYRIAGGASSPAALAGMLPVRPIEDALLLRPLLHVRPDDLREFLLGMGITWVEDPSNQDPKYTRVRIRQELRASPERVVELLEIGHGHARALADIRSAAAVRLEAAGWQPHLGGASSIDLNALGSGAPAAEAFRRVLMHAAGRYPTSSDDVILAHLGRRVGSLAGTLTWQQGGRDWVAREPSQLPAPMQAEPWSCWDGRLRLKGVVPIGCGVGPLGGDDATALRRASGTDMPHRALAVTPCLRRSGRLVAVPGLLHREPLSVGRSWRDDPSQVDCRRSEESRVAELSFQGL